jgi:hypothetical protein
MTTRRRNWTLRIESSRIKSNQKRGWLKEGANGKRQRHNVLWAWKDKQLDKSDADVSAKKTEISSFCLGQQGNLFPPIWPESGESDQLRPMWTVPDDGQMPGRKKKSRGQSQSLLHLFWVGTRDCRPTRAGVPILKFNLLPLDFGILGLVGVGSSTQGGLRGTKGERRTPTLEGLEFPSYGYVMAVPKKISIMLVWIKRNKLNILVLVPTRYLGKKKKKKKTL